MIDGKSQIFENRRLATTPDEGARPTSSDRRHPRTRAQTPREDVARLLRDVQTHRPDAGVLPGRSIPGHRRGIPPCDPRRGDPHRDIHILMHGPHTQDRVASRLRPHPLRVLQTRRRAVLPGQRRTLDLPHRRRTRGMRPRALVPERHAHPHRRRLQRSMLRVVLARQVMRLPPRAKVRRRGHPVLTKRQVHPRRRTKRMQRLHLCNLVRHLDAGVALPSRNDRPRGRLLVPRRYIHRDMGHARDARALRVLPRWAHAVQVSARRCRRERGAMREVGAERGITGDGRVGSTVQAVLARHLAHARGPRAPRRRGVPHVRGGVQGGGGGQREAHRRPARVRR